jgi:cytosine/adenosine deaminase-related metal-dependent hydrolase
LTERGKGAPQGGVISPPLANLFLHYAFDVWMRNQYPPLPFERYADDAIVHGRTETEAQEVRTAIATRMEEARRRGGGVSRSMNDDVSRRGCSAPISVSPRLCVAAPAQPQLSPAIRVPIF